MTEHDMIAALEAKGLSDIAIKTTRMGTRATYQRRDGERGAHAAEAPVPMARRMIAEFAS